MKQILTALYNRMGIKPSVIKAFEKVKRENFVLPKYKSYAYQDIALPHLCNQTISQPTTVIIMLNALNLKKGDKVLEIGTGSGYNASLIAEIINPGKLYTLEVIKQLADYSKEKLKQYKNIEVINKNGSKGYKQEMPYNKIIVTAASGNIPKELISQLEPNGILIIPVGPPYNQNMLKITKKKKLEIENLGDFVFVPLKT